tara:strand:+ start:3318 stop:3704 length:387 start_codon:yes stop_codon:yes gene_type:complete
MKTIFFNLIGKKNNTFKISTCFNNIYFYKTKKYNIISINDIKKYNINNNNYDVIINQFNDMNLININNFNMQLLNITNIKIHNIYILQNKINDEKEYNILKSHPYIHTILYLEKYNKNRIEKIINYYN